MGKGHKLAVIPMPPRVGRAVGQAAGDRIGGPVQLMNSGRRLDRHAATRIVRRLAKRAAITKHILPHSLRHSFITAALVAGVFYSDRARPPIPEPPLAMTGPATIWTVTPPTSSPPSSLPS